MPIEFAIGPLPMVFLSDLSISAFTASSSCLEQSQQLSWQSIWRAERGLNSEFVWDGLIWVLIGGIIGARLWHVFTPPPSMVDRHGYDNHYFIYGIPLT